MKNRIVIATLLLSTGILFSQTFKPMGVKELEKKIKACTVKFEKASTSFQQKMEYYRASIERDVNPARSLISISMIDGMVRQIQHTKNSKDLLEKLMPVSNLKQLISKYKKEYKIKNPRGSTLQFLIEKDTGENITKVTPYIYSGFKYNGKVLFTNLREQNSDILHNLVGVKFNKNKQYTDGKSIAQFHSSIYTFKHKQATDLIIYLHPEVQSACQNVAMLDASFENTNGVFDANNLKVTETVHLDALYNPNWATSIKAKKDRRAYLQKND